MNILIRIFKQAFDTERALISRFRPTGMIGTSVTAFGGGRRDRKVGFNEGGDVGGEGGVDKVCDDADGFDSVGFDPSGHIHLEL